MSLEKTRVFVLGAGFSAGAGIPMTDTLLTGAMELMRVECDGIYQRIEDSAQICFENDLPLINQNLNAPGFSKLCSYLHYVEMRNFGGGERWSDAGDRELLTLKYYISKKIAQITPAEIPEPYINFAQQLDCYDIVLTFNWDCLLEKALLAAGKSYTYNPYESDWCDPAKEHIVRVIKMHGSINWTLPHGGVPDPRIYNQINFDPNFNLDPIFHSGALMNAGTWENNDWLLSQNYADKYSVQPFIILPGIGKSYDVRKLAYFWDRPSGAFSTRRDAYIVGMSLSDDDFFVRFLFLESLPMENWDTMERSTVIINPSDQDLINYNFIAEEDKIIRQKPFDMEDINFMIKHRER